MNRKLREGMRSGDMEDLVLPLISVDEYVSKVSEKACVIGFYVSDMDAAKELNRFLQKSPTAILDTDVSPAPDQQGYYLVFVEILNNRQLPRILAMILDEVSPLANIDDWDMRVRGVDEVVAFSEEALAEHLKIPVNESAILAFFRESDLLQACLEGDRVCLEAAGFSFEGSALALGEIDAVLAECALNEAAVRFDAASMALTSKLSLGLGRGWRVDALGDCVVMCHNGRALVART